MVIIIVLKNGTYKSSICAWYIHIWVQATLIMIQYNNDTIGINCLLHSVVTLLSIPMPSRDCINIIVD